MTVEPRLVVVARVRKPQGIHGELLVDVMSDSPADVFSRGRTLFTEPGAPVKTLTVSGGRPFKGGYVLTFDEIGDRTAAERWRGRQLLADQAELPALGENEVYRHELIGLTVERSDGQVIGEVTGVLELPQGLALLVRTNGGEELVPYRPELVREVNLAARRVHLAPVPGLLE